MNKDCVMGGFYDYHDIWHFLSALGMFVTFLVSINIKYCALGNHVGTHAWFLYKSCFVLYSFYLLLTMEWQKQKGRICTFFSMQNQSVLDNLKINFCNCILT